MLSDLLAPDKPDRVVQYAPRYRLAFTLLNEDAAAGQAIHGWDIEDAITRGLHSHDQPTRDANIILREPFSLIAETFHFA